MSGRVVLPSDESSTMSVFSISISGGVSGMVFWGNETKQAKGKFVQQDENARVKMIQL